MLIPDPQDNPKYGGVACDILIFPDSNGESSGVIYQHQVHIEKHFVSEVTVETLRALRTEFVMCYISGSKINPIWLCHTINKMIESKAIAYTQFQKTLYTSTHEFPANVYTKDLFIEMLLAKKSKFFGKAIYDSEYDSKYVAPKSPIFLSMETPIDVVECDVLVPFFSDEYLRETLEGLMVQNNANCVIHAINDNPELECDDIVRDYPQVRWYRNRENIGQFMSVNNILNRCETDFLVINDADDVSEPDRIWLAITALELGHADIYGSQVTPFVQDDNPGTEYNHISVYPFDNTLHPLVHGTMVIRKSEFIRLGGYTDFGDVDENKCGNDTEFMLRAYCAGSRFHIGQSKSMNIRLHASSCVNHFPDKSVTRESTMRKTKIRQSIFTQTFNPASYGGGFNNEYQTERIAVGWGR